MRAEDVREAVQEFYTRHAVGGRMAEDSFPAWWLHQEFELAPGDAAACSSSGSYDHGLDGFHLEPGSDGRVTLHLIQAKFTNSRHQIREGMRGFRRTLEHLASVLDGGYSNSVENTVWVRLRARLEQQPPDALVIHCRVLHLAEVDEDTLLAESKAERSDFVEAAEAIFPDTTVRLSLTGPQAIGKPKVAVVPAAQRGLTFRGIDSTEGSHQLFIGLGKLADLVRLYDETGDMLFSKNVRLFNFRAAEKGPARHLRDTLRKICVGTDETRTVPLHFTLFHNGVTLHATSAERDGDMLRVRRVGVLNGCQTVKSAWMFRNDRTLRGRIDQEAWDSIDVPLRVVRTTDEELVRLVTVSNNRQTAIRPSGFRANESVQLELSERFRQEHIFYERQEDAFQNLRKASPATLEKEYANSFDAPLKMEDLAQALACVSVSPALSVAAKVGDLFESPLYDRLFARENLEALPLLVFSTNVLRCVHLALKDTREKTRRLEPMVASKFKFLATRALVRWVVRQQPELVEEYGTSVINRPGKNNPFRDKLRRLLSPQNTAFQTLVPDIWDDEVPWRSGTDRERSDKLLRKLRLHDFDAFERMRSS